MIIGHPGIVRSVGAAFSRDWKFAKTTIAAKSRSPKMETQHAVLSHMLGFYHMPHAACHMPVPSVETVAIVRI
jgi:hypothetical protein